MTIVIQTPSGDKARRARATHATSSVSPSSYRLRAGRRHAGPVRPTRRVLYHHRYTDSERGEDTPGPCDPRDEFCITIVIQTPSGETHFRPPSREGAYPERRLHADAPAASVQAASAQSRPRTNPS